MSLIRNNCNKNEDFPKNCIGIKPAYNWLGKATGRKVYAAFAISSGESLWYSSTRTPMIRFPFEVTW